MTVATPSDGDLVDQAAATYSQPETYFEDIKSAVRVFLTQGDGFNIIAIEGTHDALGWAVDFFGAAVEDQQGLNHQTLGFIHAGFYDAAVTALTRCALVAVRGPYAICGHSLGAALALLIGALLADDGYPPVKIGAFAPPRVGGAKFVQKVTSIPLCAYRYGNDPVPEVPLSIWSLPYVQVPLTQVGEPMANPFSCHTIRNYVDAVHATNGNQSHA